MALPLGPPGAEPTYTVWKIQPKGPGMWACYVQMPNGSNVVMVLPGLGLSVNAVILAAEVVAYLNETPRIPKRIGEAWGPPP